ncbi:MAG: GNAT family N-acetyltransferase [Rhodothermaceae bacterium]
MKKFLTSDRLYLRMLTTKDSELIYKLNSDQEVMKYVREPDTKESAKASLEKYLKFYDGNGLGIWAAHQIDDDEFIGFFIFRKYTGTEDIEIGYRIHKKYWGMGYATEMTKVLVDYGFDVLEMREMFAVTDPENKVSEKVLKKCCFRNAGTTEKYYGQKLNYFKIT